jgi:phosphomethylpyrimidine synthase
MQRPDELMIATKDSFEPQSGDTLPNSSRIYISGRIHSDLKVPFREISLRPTKSFSGQLEINEPVRVYDCSGPWGDPSFHGDVEQGLPPLRRDWILRRGDVEEYEGRKMTPPGNACSTKERAKPTLGDKFPVSNVRSPSLKPQFPRPRALSERTKVIYAQLWYAARGITSLPRWSSSPSARTWGLTR